MFGFVNTGSSTFPIVLKTIYYIVASLMKNRSINKLKCLPFRVKGHSVIENTKGVRRK